MKKYNLFLLCLMIASTLLSQHPTNLIPIEEWTEGQGSVGSFITSGTDAENVREAMIGPHGYEILGWHCENEAGTSAASGDFTVTFPIDSDKTYRFSVWMRRNDDADGTSYFWGPTSDILTLSGGAGGYATFWNGDPPSYDEWYLLVGFVHRSSHTGTQNFGGIYDTKGEKVMNVTDFKWAPTATTGKIIPYYWAAPVGDSQDMFAPRVDAINGNELSLAALLGGNDEEIPTGNILPVENWNIGSGTVSPFNKVGTDLENTRDNGLNPHGENSIIWSMNAGNGGADGGWNTDFSIDHTKTYRYTVWVRKRGSIEEGNTYLGAYNSSSGNTLRLNGTVNNNPYFWKGDVPELDKWYLIVGYVHGSGYTETTSIGGVYDGTTGEKVFNGTDYKSSLTATTQRHRAYLYYCNTCLTNGVGQDFWGPRAEMIDGNEPTISALLGIDNGPHVWSEITNGAVYNDGSIGIGIDVNDMDPAYKLLVDGDIKTRKVKVTLDGWADHVFDEDYKLTPLAEVEEYILEHRHLPGVPTEEEVLKEGLYLGEANVLLLQKIEELTLYIIQMEKKIKILEEKNKALPLPASQNR